MAKETGSCIWFSKDKGFGFLKRDKGGPDIFCHYTGIAGEGYRNLAEGDKVEFEVVQGNKGLQASEVRVV
jgi:CspA family cold shock protein